MDNAGLRFVKRVAGTVCISAVVFFLNVKFSTAQTAKQLITDGDRHFNQFDMLSAYDAYKRAAAADTTNFDALWKMAETLIELGNELPKSVDQKNHYLEAEQVAKKAVALNPNHYRGHIALALAFDRLASTQSGSDRIRRLNQMRVETEQGLKLKENSSRGFWLMGVWHREMSASSWLARSWSKIFDGSFPPASYQEAVKYLEKSCAQDDSSIVYRFDLAKTFISLEQWDRVSEELRKVVSMRPIHKNDRRYQRDAARYLEWLEAGRLSDLKDAVEEY